MIKRSALMFLAVSALTSPIQAERMPLVPKPMFRPGLYEIESRNSVSPDRGIKSKGCIASAGFDAFQHDTIAQYLELPQFRSVCTLSAAKPLPDGFAFAMDCGAAQTIIRFRVAKDFVSSTAQTRIVSRPDLSSTILTLSRRIGDCAGQKPGNAL